jgi:hypothetical protein
VEWVFRRKTQVGKKRNMKKNARKSKPQKKKKKTQEKALTKTLEVGMELETLDILRNYFIHCALLSYFIYIFLYSSSSASTFLLSMHFMKIL